MNKIELKELLDKEINNLFEKNFEKKEIIKRYNENKNKIHYLPISYRVFSGTLQSLNIKFGYFLENIIKSIVKIDELYIVDDMSGGKIKRNVSKEQSALISNYIEKYKKIENFSFRKNEFNELLNNFSFNKDEEELSRKKIDIDLLIRDNKEYFLIEVKYRDNHDTGKTENIPKKMLDTYFSLKWIIPDNKINLYLFYFTSKNESRKNKFLDEKNNILRGEEFFEKFTKTKYSDIIFVFNEFSNSKKIKKLFDESFLKIEKIIEEEVEKENSN